MDVDAPAYEHVKIDENDVRKIVLGYLVHNCFKETAETLISCSGMKRSGDYLADIDKRKRVCLSIYRCVLEGNALKAIELMKQLSADLLESDKDLHFELLILHYVELIRARDCTGALDFAQGELAPFGKQEKYVDKLQDCMALLAYAEPEASPMFYLLSSDYRQNVADCLNRAVLAHNNLPSYASIERLIQQTTIVRQRLHQELGKDGPPLFDFKTFLNR